MASQHTFKPDLRTFPADFEAWVTSLTRFRRLRAELRGGMWTFTFDSGVHMSGHQPGLTHLSSFSLGPVAVLDSVNWRRLVAARIRVVRFACRRRTDPRSVLGKQPPKLPDPQ